MTLLRLREDQSPEFPAITDQPLVGSLLFFFPREIFIGPLILPGFSRRMSVRSLRRQSGSRAAGHYQDQLSDRAKQCQVGGRNVQAGLLPDEWNGFLDPGFDIGPDFGFDLQVDGE